MPAVDSSKRRSVAVAYTAALVAARGALKSLHCLVGRALSVLGDFRRDLLPLAPRGSHISAATACGAPRRSGNMQHGGDMRRGVGIRRGGGGTRRSIVGMRRGGMAVGAAVSLSFRGRNPIVPRLTSKKRNKACTH